MKAAQITDIKTLKVVDMAEPQIEKATDVKVKVKAVGICGTDLHIYSHGRADVAFPRVMGHELSGEVVEVGADVKDLKPGDRVVLDPVFACGECPTCKKGYQNVCANVKCYGVQMEGGFKEYIVEDQKHFYTFPNSITFEQAAIAEPYSIGVNILDRAMATPEDNILVIGSGTIGLAILQVAKGIGSKVFVADVVDSKLEKAKQFGADMVCNSKTENLAEKAEAFAPGGFDVVIDAVGVTALFQQSIEFAAPRARVMSIGFTADPAQISPIVVTKKELSIIGSRMNNFKFPKVMEMLVGGKLNADVMATDKYTIEEIQTAFEDTINNGADKIKTLIVF